MSTKILNVLIFISTSRHLHLLLIMCIGFNLYSAHSVNGQNTSQVYVSFSEGRLTPVEVFDAISEQSDYRFSYNTSLESLKGTVTFDKGEISVREALLKIAKDFRIQFRRVDKNISAINQSNRNKNPNTIEEFDRTITGRVTDAEGNPLPGASIVEKGTSNGTTTDFDGKFSLAVKEDAKALEVYYLGYETREVPLTAQDSYEIVLTALSSELDEVVVVGYGTQNKRELTGSVSKTTEETIDRFPSSTVEQSLIGNIPGVHLVSSSGAPGAGVSIRVRGVTSIAGGNEPLLVIDGVPVFNQNVQGFNSLASINPNDIESIEVLKDASATAIYGSRGGNGVILITTKSGKGAQSFVNYSSWYRVDRILNKIDVMNAQEFQNYLTTWSTNSGIEIPDDALRGADTDWQDEISRTALVQNHLLSLGGSNQRNSYYASLGYLNQEGIIVGSDFERLSLRVNLENQVKNWLNIKTNITGTRAIQNGVVPAQNNNTFSVSKTTIGAALFSPPTIPVYDSGGEFSSINSFVENPVLYAEQVLDKLTVNRWITSLTLEAKIYKGLANNARIGADFTNQRKDLYFPSTLEIVLGGDGAGSIETNNSFNYVFEDFLEYRENLGEKTNIHAILGFSFQRDRRNTVFNEGSGFISDQLQNNALQSASVPGIPITTTVEQSIASFFSRINISFQNKYLLGFSYRRDAASVFSENNKVADFPSLSAGWRISEEDVFEDSAISDLKVRASWGKSGNPAIQPYQSLPLGILNIGSQGVGTGLNVGLAPNLPNRNLTWETTVQTNIGLDFGLFNQRVNGSIDYYRKDTEDALATLQLAPSAGFNSIIANVGEVRNTGLEVAINTEIVKTKKVQLNLGANISFNSNEVTRTNDGQDIVSTLSDSNGGGEIFNVIREGEELGSLLGFVFTGFDENNQPTYLDVNEDGNLDSDDYQIIGSPFADLVYGINANLQVGRFSLDALFQGVGGKELYNVMLYQLSRPSQFEVNRIGNFFDFFPNPSNESVDRASDRFVEDASYFRLRTLRIGYSLPVKGEFLEALDVYLSGQNLFTITDYSGYDPEINSFNNNNLNQGIDLSAYPSAKSYTFGLNLKF